MATVAYARVSTSDQDLTVQRQQLEAAGYDKLFEEKVSGSKCDNRPQFQPKFPKIITMPRQGWEPQGHLESAADAWLVRS